jgi:hypothetical protein
MKIIGNGNFTAWFRVLLWASGIAIAVSSYFILTGLFMFAGVMVGMLVLATGTYAEQANLLNLKPFGSGYKKVRESYKVEDNKGDNPK